jgi:HPt (histidine-containing phosphotransfer) domain-containing protein
MPSDSLHVRIDPLLADLVPVYLDNKRKDVEQGWGALRDQDFACLRRIGHNLKGSAGGYGFAPLERIGAALERAAIAGEARSLERSLQQAADYLSRVEVTFD